MEQKQQEDCLLVAACRSHAPDHTLSLPVQRSSLGPTRAKLGSYLHMSLAVAAAARCCMKFHSVFALLLLEGQCCTHENLFQGVVRVSPRVRLKRVERTTGFRLRPHRRRRCRVLCLTCLRGEVGGRCDAAVRACRLVYTNKVDRMPLPTCGLLTQSVPYKAPISGATRSSQRRFDNYKNKRAHCITYLFQQTSAVNNI